MNYRDLLKPTCMWVSLFCIQTLHAQDIALLMTQAQDYLSQLDSRSQQQTSTQASFEIPLVRIQSPYTYQNFEADIDVKSPAYLASQLKVICPYTGKAFFIGPKDLEYSSNLVFKKVRSPYTGQFFSANIDIDALLTGDIREQILACPYTGKTFKFSLSESNKHGTFSTSETSFQMILDPRVNKFFKVFTNNGKFPLTAISPYSGVLIQLPTAGENKKNLSPIEKTFNNILLQNKATEHIYQFGYNIFNHQRANISHNRDKKSLLSSKTRPSNNLFNTKSLLGIIPRAKTSFEEETFEPIESCPVSPDYIIGPDDEFIIDIWGKAQQEIMVMVSRDGKILLPKIGPIYVWGKTFKEAIELIKENMNQQYTNIQINVTMGRLRTIRVFVLGDVVRPGGYILSSRSTAFHALFRALGPTKKGSLRNVTIKKRTGDIITLDLYNLILNGDISKDVRLESNDIVFINTIGHIIGIAGEVKKPAIYETKEALTIDQAISLAGGFSHLARKNHLQLIRTSNQKAPIIEDIDYLKHSQIVLAPGDVIIVPQINMTPSNFVILEGHTSEPGKYAFSPNMSLKSLFQKSGAFLPNTYTKRLEIIRKTAGLHDKIISLDFSQNTEAVLEQFRLHNHDRIRLFSRQEVRTRTTIEVRGMVNNPGKYQYYTDITINDLLFSAGGLNVPPSNAIAEIYTKSSQKGGKLLEIPLNNIINNPNGPSNIKLLPDNILIIRGQKVASGTQTITLEGAFKNPGEFIVCPNDRLSDIIFRAGGFRDDAFLPGAKFLRKSLKKAQEKFAEQATLNERRNLLKEEALLIKGTHNGDTSANNRSDLLFHRKELLNLLSKSRITGRMLITLSDMETFVGSNQDISLENGDRLIVPVTPSTVQVLGSVYNNAAVLYEFGRGALYYIGKLGGFMPGANRKNVYIIRANGEVISNFFKIKEIARGDTIVVPESFHYKTPQGVLVKDTVEILYKLALGAAVIANLN